MAQPLMRAALLGLTIVSLACKGATPVEPDPTYMISGTVRSDLTGEGLEGAQAQLKGTSFTVTTPASGAFSFGGLAGGTYTLAISRAGFTDQTHTVTLDRQTGSVALTITLVHLPFADLIQEGTLTSTANPPDYTAWTFRGAGRNRGDACAGTIGAIVELLNGLDQVIARREFALPADLIVAPLARFEFESCCWTTDELDQASRHRTTFTFQTVPCP